MYIDIYWRRIIHLHVELSVRRLIPRGINSRDDFTRIFSMRKGQGKKKCGSRVPSKLLISYRNALTEKAWEAAIQGIGKLRGE